MNCPNCDKPLNRFTFMDVQLDDCADCGGIWFDAEELQRVKQATPEAWAKLEAQIAPRSAETTAPKGVVVKKCPACGVEMHPYRYMFNSDVHLDECEQCGGTWVDDAELAAMTGFLQQAQQEAAAAPKGQLTPEEMDKIREHVAMTEQRASHVFNALPVLRMLSYNPARFTGWFGTMDN